MLRRHYEAAPGHSYLVSQKPGPPGEQLAAAHAARLKAVRAAAAKARRAAARSVSTRPAATVSSAAPTRRR
ncbi:hypothetical protein AB0J38_22125 [Streptomyces sp. NPDC050095]|uniref:hypothetical protein n=1 Tax=unclassified Streptomyces TaxID=2593676 RepID=UPI00343C2A09